MSHDKTSSDKLSEEKALDSIAQTARQILSEPIPAPNPFCRAFAMFCNKLHTDRRLMPRDVLYEKGHIKLAHFELICGNCRYRIIAVSDLITKLGSDEGSRGCCHRSFARRADTFSAMKEK